MKASECIDCITIPAWVPQAASMGCITMGLVVFFICYVLEEVHRHKEFYGKTDQLTEKERMDGSSNAERQRENELDAVAFGDCPGNVILRKDNDPRNKSPGFLVLVPHRKRAVTPIPLQADLQQTPVKTNNAHLSGPSPNSPYKLLIHTTFDKTGRAEELLKELKKDNYARDAKFEVIDSILVNTMEILEKMTRRLFLVVALVNDAEGNKTIIRGQEHMQETNVEELVIKMKLELVQPFKASIVIYQFEAASEPEVKLDPTPFPVVPNANEKVKTEDEEIQTDVTPQITPMIQSVKPTPGSQVTQMSASRRTGKPAGVTQSSVVNALMKSRGLRKDELLSEKEPIAPPPASPILRNNSEKGAIRPPTSGRKSAVSRLESKNKTPRTLARNSGKKVKESLKTRPISNQQTSTDGGVKQPKSNTKGRSLEKIIKSSKQMVTSNVKNMSSEDLKGSLEKLRTPSPLVEMNLIAVQGKAPGDKESLRSEDNAKMAKVQTKSTAGLTTTTQQSTRKGSGQAEPKPVN